jgi:hypothetical protein
VEPNNARQLVEIAARDIEKLLSNRSKALVVSFSGVCSLHHSPLHCAMVHTAVGGLASSTKVAKTLDN